MGLSNFYSAAATRRPAVIDRMALGGEMVDLRHLTLANVFQLWDAMLPHLDAMCSYFSETKKPPEERDHSWVSPLYFNGLRILWPERGVAWVQMKMEKKESLAAEAESAQEFAYLKAWYIQNHDWMTILSKIFNIKVGGEEVDDVTVEPSNYQAVEQLYLLEENSHRLIEDFLAMTPEAFVDYREARIKISDEKERMSRQSRLHAKGKKSVTIQHQDFWMQFPRAEPPPTPTEGGDNGE